MIRKILGWALVGFQVAFALYWAGWFATEFLPDVTYYDLSDMFIIAGLCAVTSVLNYVAFRLVKTRKKA